LYKMKITVCIGQGFSRQRSAGKRGQDGHSLQWLFGDGIRYIPMQYPFDLAIIGLDA